MRCVAVHLVSICCVCRCAVSGSMLRTAGETSFLLVNKRYVHGILVDNQRHFSPNKPVHIGRVFTILPVLIGVHVGSRERVC